MPFIKQLNKDFFIKNNHIELSPEYIKNPKFSVKKVTGTTFGSVLGLNKYKTPLKTWAIMVGIYKETMDETLAKTGTIIEPKIREYAQEKLNLKFKVYNPHEIKYDVFKDDKVYGGIPDGEPVDEFGNISYSDDKPMLEVKTSSCDSLVYKQTEENQLRMVKDENGFPIVKVPGGKKAEWFDADNKFIIPLEYKYQLGLYLYLRKVKKGVFAVGFLQREDYKNMEDFDPNKREIHLVNFSIKDPSQLEKAIEYGREWYKKYVKSEPCISPKISSKEDIDWLKKELKIEIC